MAGDGEKDHPRGFWNKFLLAFGAKKSEDAQKDREIIANAFLLKKEKQKCDRLNEKLDKEYLQRDIKIYREELLKIIKPKLNPSEGSSLEKLEIGPFFLAVVELLRQKKIALDQKEAQQCWHYLSLLKQIIQLKVEISHSLEMEKNYAVVSQLATYQQLYAHLYVLIENLTSKVDQKIESLLSDYFKEQLLLHHYPQAECLNQSEVKEAFNQQSETIKQDILNTSKMDALIKTIIQTVGLQIAYEIKSWVHSSLKRYETPENPPTKVEQGREQMGTADQESSSHYGNMALPRMNVELSMKDLQETLQKFMRLKTMLDPSELKKKAFAFVTHE